jgi:antitoxin component YwqK of YwqJK toxin-antitoxin module
LVVIGLQRGVVNKHLHLWDNVKTRLKGQYEEMHRIGTWTNYDSNGDIILEEQYDNNKTQTVVNTR